MSRNYRCVRFVNLSMSSLGVFSDECSTFLDMMNDIGIDKKQQRYIIKKMINIAIRATYYIFCCRNRNWDSPDLMQFWRVFFWLLFCFVFVFVFFSFLIIQSQAVFVNCVYVARFTIVHSKTQINIPLLLLLLSSLNFWMTCSSLFKHHATARDLKCKRLCEGFWLYPVSMPSAVIPNDMWHQSLPTTFLYLSRQSCSNRELKHQTFLIHERHGWPRRTGSGTQFACQM